jgi:hypothetical protein
MPATPPEPTAFHPTAPTDAATAPRGHRAAVADRSLPDNRVNTAPAQPRTPCRDAGATPPPHTAERGQRGPRSRGLRHRRRGSNELPLSGRPCTHLPREPKLGRLEPVRPAGAVTRLTPCRPVPISRERTEFGRRRDGRPHPADTRARVGCGRTRASTYVRTLTWGEIVPARLSSSLDEPRCPAKRDPRARAYSTRVVNTNRDGFRGRTPHRAGTKLSPHVSATGHDPGIATPVPPPPVDQYACLPAGWW